MPSDDLIDFEIIENQKENIQSLPSGRSAKALAQLYSPPLSLGSLKTPPPSHTQDLNNAIRQEYEKELLTIDDSDDPLDIYDRYVKWTLDAYPSAQNTPQSQLSTLLERATKAFQGSTHYKNDPRYLKLWLHYIRLFSDAPRETFAYLARHNIGDGLALFYEEFASWLENAGRWTQAEEVYKLGLEREARPTERLMRKFGEFENRFAARPQDVAEPSSPALPTVRPALAAKIDPFAHTSSPIDPQAQSRAGSSTGASRTGRQKLAIFSDGDEAAKPGSSGSTKGWDSIGSLADRKKENTVGAKPWAGETLKAGKKNAGVPKMMIFKDEVNSSKQPKSHPLRDQQQSVNPKTGRTECVFVNLELVYPNADDPSAAEFSFEELRAKHRGWLDYDWGAIRKKEAEQMSQHTNSKARKDTLTKKPTIGVEVITAGIEENLVLNDENTPPSQVHVEKVSVAKKMRREEKANRTRKIKVMEVRAEPQTVQTNLASPTGPKLRKKRNAEPTMTFHTKEAMDEIYGIFNQPLKTDGDSAAESESGEDSDDDDDYTSAGESTGTGRISGTTSEFGDETTGVDFTTKTTMDDEEDEADETEIKSVSEWSEFTASKHIPDGENPDQIGSENEHTDDESWEALREAHLNAQGINQELVTPTSPDIGSVSLPTRFVPIPPEGCDVPTRPFRDPTQVAHNRLPFMTPIVEKTESSIGAATARSQKDYFSVKTPSRSKGASAILEDDGEPWSSPFQDVLEEALKKSAKIPQPALGERKKESKQPLGTSKARPLAKKTVEAKESVQKGPIIKDAQCNPVDEGIREIILSQIQPPLSSYEGYSEDKDKAFGRGAEIRKFTKAVSKMNKNANDKTATNLMMPPALQLKGSDRAYAVRRELGKGAFAPVYLVESSPVDEEDDEEKPVMMGKGDFGVKRQPLEAIKMEDPPSAWEFYMLRQAKRRLGVSRPADSVVYAYEMHMFQDEGFLVEEFRDQGTLLDLVNIARAETNGSGGMEEQMAMFFSIELFRTVEALHAKGIIHGDLKADNILVRLESLAPDAYWTSQYQHDGRDGWAAKGVSLIDFGRGIDMKVFKPDVQFIADWKTSEGDCAEMRELRPWTYQVDYHGLAGIVHSLLFGKYIETVAERGGTLGAGATKTYRIRESLKRYWQTEIWSEMLDLLLNPLMHLEGEEGRKLPVLKGMKAVRERMEAWLEANCEKGVGLKAMVRRMETAVKERKK
ncbi:checkpoint protein kinase-like protein [Mytilinidion resinicola]|uniref:Checkpoint protein kinase-like protein n=1 Tax=Mytilinidion resinicola TaxID=574789 RepID=A0A6A6YFV1_9PEZI|nr:checkpoint protein kinase-like protein [Mytilinidion resinicola]KAF2807681.1 checkpoint protein kinase-like protein [Mytilinidion resinicola]